MLASCKSWPFLGNSAKWMLHDRNNQSPPDNLTLIRGNLLACFEEPEGINTEQQVLQAYNSQRVSAGSTGSCKIFGVAFWRNLEVCNIHGLYMKSFWNIRHFNRKSVLKEEIIQYLFKIDTWQICSHFSISLETTSVNFLWQLHKIISSREHNPIEI